MGARRPTASSGDALLWAGSAGFALALLGTSGFVTFRTWGRLAGPAYLVAAALALAAARADRLLDESPRHRDPRVALRAAATGVVLVGAVLLPLLVLVRLRAAGGPGAADHAQSDVVVLERAADLLGHGHVPYDRPLGSDELAGRLPGIALHVPYLPVLLLAGLPAALLPGTWWTDPRLVLLAVAVAALVAAARVGGWPPRTRSGMARLLVLAPTGALPLAAGGTDVALAAALVLVLTLLARGRPSGRWVLALAAAAKATVWPVLLAAVAETDPRRHPARAARLLAPTVLLLPVALLLPGAAVDVLGYPAGLTGDASPVTTPTPGTALLAGLTAAGLPVAGPARAAGVAALLLGGLLAGDRVARLAGLRWPPGPSTGVGRVAVRAAGGWVGVLLAAPAIRPGYVIYPLALLGWAVLAAGARVGRPRAPAASPPPRAVPPVVPRG